MMTFQNQLKELVQLTQVFLRQESNLKENLITDKITQNYFRPFLIKHTQLIGSPPLKPMIRAISPDVNPGGPNHGPTPPPSPDTGPLTPPSPNPDVEPRTPESPDNPPNSPSIEPTPKPAQPEEPKPTTIKYGSPPSKGPFIQLEPLPSPAPCIEVSTFKHILKTIAPAYLLTDTILDDAMGVKNKNKWKLRAQIPPIIILSFNEEEKSIIFLKNLSRAIQLHLAPARILSAHKIEKEKKWESIVNLSDVRLIIASDDAFYSLPGLMQYYREVPQESKHYLNSTPLLLLSQLSLYLKDPQLKPLLWRTICAEFETLAPF